MKGRLFTILSALSLLLFVAVVVLWVRSYTFVDELAVIRDRRWRFFSLQGRLNVYVHATYGGPPDQPPTLVSARNGDARVAVSFCSKPPDEFWYMYMEDEWFKYHYQETAGRGVYHGPTQVWGERGHSFILTFPHWLAMLFTGLPVPGIMIRSTYQRTRRSGLCPSCSYDLRATPGRCPECGIVPTEAKALNAVE